MALIKYEGEGYTFHVADGAGNFGVQLVVSFLRDKGINLGWNAADGFILAEGFLQRFEIEEDNELPEALVEYLRNREGKTYEERWQTFKEELSLSDTLHVSEAYDATRDRHLKIEGDAGDSQKKDSDTSEQQSE